MAASDHLNGTQLKLFMTPDELLGGDGYVHGSVDQVGESISEMTNYKVKNAKENGLYDQVAKEGVRTPVIVSPYEADSVRSWNSHGKPGTFILGNGNHRTSIAADVQRKTGKTQFVPVIHDEDYMGRGAAKNFDVDYW